MDDLVVWVADVGSIKNYKFGWCRKSHHHGDEDFGTDIKDFAEGIARDISAGDRVALGFECPLFVPITENPRGLTSARPGEGDRPWSAGAGCGALATGLTETVWVFERLKKLSRVDIVPTCDWEEFNSGYGNLFIWEAFVTKESKANSHHGDAQVAAESFWNRYPCIDTNVIAENPFSLVGAALLRSGLTEDLEFLNMPVVVIRS